MIECVLAQDCNDCLEDLFIRNRPMRGNAFGSVLLVFAAEAEDNMGYGTAKQLILGLAACFERLEFCEAFIFKTSSLGAEAIGFFMIKRAHVSLSNGSRGAEDTFLATASAGAIP